MKRRVQYNHVCFHYKTTYAHVCFIIQIIRTRKIFIHECPLYIAPGPAYVTIGSLSNTRDRVT